MRRPALPLKPFTPPANQSLALRVDVRYLMDRIEFEFFLYGPDLSRVLLPEMKAPELRTRRDELWKSTCLELFLAKPDGTSYVEMNVSPSGDWAAYSFDDYRVGMKPANGKVVLQESPASSEPYFRLAGSLCPDGSGDVEGLLAVPDLVFAATAVLEYSNGEREYWALTHSGTKPDFHLRASFTGRLQRPS